MNGEMEFHPIADIFPMLGDADLNALADDIKANGLREPIWVYEEKILDGRNRYRACAAGGVKPAFRTYAGESPTSFVLSLNLHRRHLSYDQRVGLAVKIEPMIAAEIEQQRREKISAARKGETQTNSSESKNPPILAANQAAKQTKVGQTAVKEMKAAAMEQPALIDDLINGKVTVKQTRATRNRKKKVAAMQPFMGEPAPLESIQQRYSIIYADPPWRYDPNTTDPSRVIENQYPTMPIEEITALPVRELATDNAILFLWVTSPMLAKSIDLIRAWGFSYQSSMVWVKDRIGPGYWVRSQHEFLLIATRGDPAKPKPEDRVASVVNAPRGEHSAKPVEFYQIIERMYPELPKIELFSRQRREGWMSWGNQI